MGGRGCAGWSGVKVGKWDKFNSIINKIYFLKKTSSTDGGIGKQALPPHTTMAKITTRLQNKCYPELSENQAVWKSNNQRIKKATSIQTGRRGGDMEMCEAAQRCGMNGPSPTCGR